MTDVRWHRASLWELALPVEWSSVQSRDGSLYFEAGDGTKGVYVTAWYLGEQDTRSAPDVAAAFRAADLDVLAPMQGYRWELVARQEGMIDGVHVGITDMLAAANSYRSIGKILSAPPYVVRANFLDYACGDCAASQTFFAAIVESFRFRREPAGDDTGTTS